MKKKIILIPQTTKVNDYSKRIGADPNDVSSRNPQSKITSQTLKIVWGGLQSLENGFVYVYVHTGFLTKLYYIVF